MSTRMPRRKTLFWDVDPKKINPKKNARYIIARIMDFGTDAEVRWMWKTYTRTLLKNVATHSRGLHPQSRALWKNLTK